MGSSDEFEVLDADGIPSGLGFKDGYLDGFSHFLLAAKDFVAAEWAVF